MSCEEIVEKVVVIFEINFEYGMQFDVFIILMIEMDEYKFDWIISINIQ